MLVLPACQLSNKRVNCHSHHCHRPLLSATTIQKKHKRRCRLSTAATDDAAANDHGSGEGGSGGGSSGNGSCGGGSSGIDSGDGGENNVSSIDDGGGNDKCTSRDDGDAFFSEKKIYFLKEEKTSLIFADECH